MGVLDANREAPEVSHLSADPKAATRPGGGGLVAPAYKDIPRALAWYLCALNGLKVKTI